MKFSIVRARRECYRELGVWLGFWIYFPNKQVLSYGLIKLLRTFRNDELKVVAMWCGGWVWYKTVNLCLALFSGFVEQMYWCISLLRFDTEAFGFDPGESTFSIPTDEVCYHCHFSGDKLANWVSYKSVCYLTLSTPNILFLATWSSRCTLIVL